MERLNIRVSDRISVTIEDQDMREVVRKGAFWSELPSECPLCKASVVFLHRTPQDNEYFGMRCLGYPAHETNFGQYKNIAKGLFYKREWHLAFQGNQGQDDQSSQQQPQYTPQPTQQQQYAAQAPQVQQPVNPVATNLGDMITSKQLGMIRAIAREAGLHSDAESNALFGCNADQLSKRAASDYIEHLQKVQLGEKARLTYPPQPAVEAQVQQVAAAQPAGVNATAMGMPAASTTPPTAVQSQPDKTFKGPPVGTEQHGSMCRCVDCSNIPF